MVSLIALPDQHLLYDGSGQGHAPPSMPSIRAKRPCVVRTPQHGQVIHQHIILLLIISGTPVASWWHIARPTPPPTAARAATATARR